MKDQPPLRSHVWALIEVSADLYMSAEEGEVEREVLGLASSQFSGDQTLGRSLVHATQDQSDEQAAKRHGIRNKVDDGCQSFSESVVGGLLEEPQPVGRCRGKVTAGSQSACTAGDWQMP